MKCKRGLGHAEVIGWRIQTVAILLLCLSTISVAVCAAGATGASQVEVRVGKTVEITSSHRYCWFPTVHRFATGEIMVTMQMSPDEVNPEGDFSAYCISKDGGLTWSRRYTMGAGALNNGAFTESPRPDGSIWDLYGWTGGLDVYPPGQAQQFHLTLTKFSRAGMEIFQRRDIVLRMSQPMASRPSALFDRGVPDGFLLKQFSVTPWGHIIKALNGDLLVLVESRTAEGSKYHRDILVRSSDGGRTWRQYSVVAAVPGDQPWPWMGKEGPDEAALVRLADKRLLTVFRTGSDGHMGETWSSDDGKTWTPPIAAPFKGVCPRVRRLSDGMLAITTGRPDPVEIMFSPDGTGKEWTSPTTIFTGKSTHYTDLIEIKPGELFVVYDSIPYGWYEIPFADRKSKNTIYGTFIEFHKK